MNKTRFNTIKISLLIFTLSIFSNHLIAQTTNGIFFQAVARDNFSNPAKDRKIYVQSSIIQTTPTGTKVLTEEHQANTDATGVFSISLGNGVRVGGTASGLATIDWSKGPFYLNLKVAITPIGGNSNWDYTKEWVDMGTTSFGAVPFALYSASSAKVDDKLNVSDTTTMLKVYAKAIKVQSLETSLATKLTAADTLTMLAPYAKAAYTIDSSFFKSQLATKLSLTDTINYTKQKYTDSAIAKKLNIADSAIYVTKTQLAGYNFSTGGGGVTVDTTSLSNRISLKANATEITILTSSLGNKLSIADSTKYVTPTQLAAKTFDTTSLSSRINLKAAVSDVTSAINAEATTARAAELALTNNINSNTASITANAAAINAEATTARAAELALTNNINSNTVSITSNTASITSNAAAITAEATTARAAELILTNNIASSTSSITAINTILSEATSSNTANTLVKRDASGNLSAGSITASNYASTPISLSYTGSTINWNPTTGANAAITLTQNSTLSFSATPLVGSYGTVVLTQDGTGGRTITLPTIPSVTNKVLGSATNTTVSLSNAANAKDILNFYYDGTNCYWNIGQGYGSAPTASFTLTTTGTGAATLSGTTLNIPSVSSTVNAGSISGTIAVANGGTGATTLTGYVKGTGTTAMTASGSIPVADVTGAAPLASPTFTGTVTTSTINTGALSATSVTTPIYASTPQVLTDGATISWNPANGLNASVTLAGNRTLSFTSTPAAGSYGTLVVTQDATGGRTITLPSTTNKVLGSTSGTTIALSTTANAKDILNFYYDGTNCYWNIGQGYGAAATASFTLTTTGTGAATLSGTTLNIPSVSSTVNSGSISGTIAVANGGTGVTTSTGTGNVVLSTSPTLITPALGTPSAVVLTSATGLPLTTGVTGTLAVGNGGTGATTLTGYVKGTGTTAMTASANIPVADVTGAAPLASPTFTGTVTTATINTGALSATSVNTPIYASTPQALTDGETISWNPTLGLNASVTLAGNRTLSFTSTPAVGSYGTVVLTQDGTGGRTITLPTIPSVTNKVLGSATNTTVSLSTAANAKDILNFYYDGTNCYWNIGQGYGNAATASFTLTTTGTGAATLSGTTLNIPSVSSTVNSGSISGTIAVANGGTGASTQQASINALTGTQTSGRYLRSDGTNATLANIQAADIPTLNQNTTGNAATATFATSATTAGNITATSNGTLTSLSMLNTVGTITTGTISVTTDIKTSGTLTAGAVTYPNTHGTSGQVLSTTGSGTLTWTTTAAPSDASTTAKGLIQLAGDLRGTATSPTVNTVGGVNSSTITTFDTRITSVTNSTTSNTSSITSLNTSVNAATNINTISTIVKRDESGNFSAGTITANLTGNVTGSLTGNASTATTAGNVTGTVAVANGGTGATTVANALTNLGAAPISSPIFTDIPQAPTAVVGTNNTQIATTAFVKSAIRLNSDEFTATTGQTSFAFTTATSNTGAVQIPLTKPFMYINGTRIKNTAYSWTAGASTVTYNPTNNSSYTLVAGDRIQFDYAY